MYSTMMSTEQVSEGAIVRHRPILLAAEINSSDWLKVVMHPPLTGLNASACGEKSVVVSSTYNMHGHWKYGGLSPWHVVNL